MGAADGEAGGIAEPSNVLIFLFMAFQWQCQLLDTPIRSSSFIGLVGGFVMYAIIYSGNDRLLCGLRFHVAGHIGFAHEYRARLASQLDKWPR
jgi:hypothetical protein